MKALNSYKIRITEQVSDEQENGSSDTCSF